MLVSVVVPCFNSRAYVSRTLDSVFAQTYPVLELICVDDGSRDGTADLLREIRKRSPIAMQVIPLDQNSGACAARNAGLQVARGAYVQFLDSDDLLEADKITHQLKLINRKGVKADLVAADCIIRNDNGAEVVRQVDRRGPLFGLVASTLGNTCANLWCTESLRRVGGFNDQMRTSNEYELMFRLIQQGATVVLDPMPKTVICKRSASLSRSVEGRPDFCVRFVQLRVEMLNYIEEQGQATGKLRQLCHDTIFKHVRELSLYDLEAAAKLYATALPLGFVPSDYRASVRERMLLRLLGFRGAQRVERLLRLK